MILFVWSLAALNVSQSFDGELPVVVPAARKSLMIVCASSKRDADNLLCGDILHESS